MKFVGEKCTFFHGNHLFPAGSANLIPPQTNYGFTAEFAFKPRVFLGTLSQQEPPGPLLVCYLAPWHDQTPPALAGLVSPLGANSVQNAMEQRLQGAHWGMAAA